MFWRDNAMIEGVLRCSTACLYAPTVSMPPAGRIIMMSGMARNDARVVRHHVDHAGLGQCSHTDRSAHVVGEDEERGAVGDEARAVQRNASGDGAHGMLAHAEAQVTLGVLALLEVAKHLHQRQVGRRKVGRATDEARQRGCQAVQHRLRPLASRQALVLGRHLRQRILPAGRQLARRQRLKLGPLCWVLLGILLAPLLPLRLRLGALVHALRKDLLDVGWHLKLAKLPLEVGARRCRLLGAQRRAMHVVCVSLVGRAIANKR
eukprot:363664-Chlamydomonas_euryale.AAC.24